MKNPRITAFEIVSLGVLLVTWNNTETYQIDISDSLKTGMKSVDSMKMFSKAVIGEFGLSIDWPGDIGIGADTLYCDALAQAGKAYPTNDFNEWMKRNKLSLSGAAEVLGISRRMIAYYNIGAKPIPKHIGLACRGWELMNKSERDKLHMKAA